MIVTVFICDLAAIWNALGKKTLTCNLHGSTATLLVTQAEYEKIQSYVIAYDWTVMPKSVA